MKAPKTLTLKNGLEARLVGYDDFCRPVYSIANNGVKVKVVALNEDGTNLHSRSSWGEPEAPLRSDFQPVE